MTILIHRTVEYTLGRRLLGVLNFNNLDEYCQQQPTWHSFYKEGLKIEVFCVVGHKKAPPDGEAPCKIMFSSYVLIALTPGSSLPSMYSRSAPPPVDTKLT